MWAAGLICDLRRLKFVHLSERKGVCGVNALKFVILRVKNVLNSDILAFSKALSAKSVANSACGITSQSVLLGRSVVWQGVVNLATHNTAWWRVWQRNSVAKFNGTAKQARQIQHGENVAVLAGKAKMGAVFGRRTSLSRCSHLWHAFGLNLKGFFAHFIVVLFRFIVDFAHFIAISSYRKFFLFYCGFFSSFCSFISSFRGYFSLYRHFILSFCLQKTFFRAFCFFKIFKCFVFRLFALVIASHFHKNGVAIHKFSIIFAFWIATLALLSCNDGQRKCTSSFRYDGGFCHFERSD